VSDRFPRVTNRALRLAPLVLLAAGCRVAPTRVAAEPAARSAAGLPHAEALVTFDSAWAVIHRTHWDTTFNGVDWRALGDSLRPRAAAAPTREALRTVLQELVTSLGQSHFAILPGDASPAVEADGDSDDSGTVGVETRWIDDGHVIVHVVRGTPAERVGVRPGDRILAIDGKPVDGPRRAESSVDADARRDALTAWRLLAPRLQGPVGQSVELTLDDATGARRDVRVERIAPPGVATRFGQLPTQHVALNWERRLVDGKQIGIIRFNVWMPVIARAFDVAIDSLRSADAIVLDLRGNMGGVAGMSMGFAGHLIDSAVPVGVMTTRGHTMRFTINPRRVSTAAERVAPFAGPVGVVVDALSASTTEIFVGGLQDLGRARVFGTQTAGQALPAVASRLPNGDVLYHAIADFRAPSGRALEGAGVTPDERIHPTRAALAAGADPALDRALGWAAATARRAAITHDDDRATTAPAVARPNRDLPPL
jgi:carboxyl-terminal processing protease